MFNFFSLLRKLSLGRAQKCRCKKIYLCTFLNVETYVEPHNKECAARHSFIFTCQKSRRHHEPPLLRSLSSFCVDCRSIMIGNTRRWSAYRVSVYVSGKNGFANISNVLPRCRSMSVASSPHKCKCFVVNLWLFRMLLVSDSSALTLSIRRYIVCSCTPSIGEDIPPSSILIGWHGHDHC